MSLSLKSRPAKKRGLDTTSVRYGAFILTFANILSQLLGFLYRMVLTRLIGAEGMGLFQLIFPFYSLALSLASTGICVAVSRLSAEYLALGNYGALRAIVRRAFLMFLFVFSLISAFALLFADKIATGFLGDERTKLAVYGLIPVIFFTGIENIHKNYLYGTKDVNPPAISDLFEQIIRMTSVIVLLRIFLPQPDNVMLLLIVGGMLVCEICSSMFLRAVYINRRKKLPLSDGDDPNMRRRIIKTAAPISVANLINNLLSSMIVILIPRLLMASGLSNSEALSEYGILFGMTMPLLNLPSALIVGIGLVMVPKLSENLATGNYADLRHKISRAIMVTSFAVLPVLAVMVPLGDELGYYLFGQVIDGRYLLPLAVGTALAIYMSIFGNILNGLGRQTSSSVSFLIGNLAELILVIFLISKPEIRLNGYVIALLASTLITFSLNLYRVSKVAKLKIEWVRWFVNPALSAILAALCARLFFLHLSEIFSGGFALLLAIVGAALVYLGAAAYQGVSLKGISQRKNNTNPS